MSESAAQRFSDEMKAWRKHLDLTQKEFADRTTHSYALVSAVEQCVRSPSPEFASACDSATGAPGTFARWQKQVVEESYPSFFAPVIELEQRATRAHYWDLGAIPGLLQTDAYARALVEASRPADSPDAIERTVQARIERQGLLSRDRPPMLWYVIDEGILHHVIGSAEVMAEQLDKLLDCASRHGIMVQVLPFTANDHAGTDGTIAVYDFEGGAPSVGYTECHRGGRLVEAQTEVADLMVVIGMLRAAALPVRESAAVIRNVRSELS